MRPLNLAINHQPTFNTTLFFTFFYEHCSPFWVILWVSYIDLLPLQLCSSTCWTLLQCSLLLLFFTGSTVLPSLSYTPGYSWTLDSIHCSDYLPVLDIWLCLFFAQSWFLVLCSFAVSGVFPSIYFGEPHPIPRQADSSESRRTTRYLPVEAFESDSVLLSCCE